MVSFPQVFPPKPCAPLSPAPYAPYAPPISFFSILPPAQYSVRRTDHLSSSLCNFLHSPVTSSLLGPNTLLNALFSNTLSLRSSLNVSEKLLKTKFHEKPSGWSRVVQCGRSDMTKPEVVLWNFANAPDNYYICSPARHSNTSPPDYRVELHRLGRPSPCIPLLTSW